MPDVRSSLHVLNEVFTSASIVKVLHGAEYDIIWLQRDFGLYIVNLFDTYRASRQLERTTGHSLASLLAEYTEFVPDKRYQLADWRIRPLGEEMLHYARSDTHFLIYVYGKIVHDSRLTPESIQDIRKRSAQTAQQAYSHAVYDFETGVGPAGWRGLLERSGKSVLWNIDGPHTDTPLDVFGIRRFETFRAAHDWRDRTARETDESPRYILSNKMLQKIAESLPDSMEELNTALGAEMRGILKEKADNLLDAIKVGRAEAEDRVAALRATADQPDTAAAERPATAPPAAQLNGTAATPLFSMRTPSAFTRPLEAVKSSLFAKLSSDSKGTRVSAFDKILSKVHGDLIGQMENTTVAPKSENGQMQANGSGPRAASPPARSIEADLSNVEATSSVLDGDHLFVSKEQRAQKAAKKEEMDADIIQISSKPRGSKRKSGDMAGQTKRESAIEPFDYSKVTSVLDAPVGEAGDDRAAKKQKKKDKKEKSKAGNNREDGFANAPKSMNQPKAGNKSYTF